MAVCKCGPLIQPVRRLGAMGKGTIACRVCGGDAPTIGGTLHVKLEDGPRPVKSLRDPYADRPECEKAPEEEGS